MKPEILQNLPALLAAMFTAILFIQSGLDKVFDWKGNVEWLTGHFSKTPLAGMVPIMLAKLTLLELATGLLSAAGAVYLVAAGSVVLIFWAAVLGAVTILGLFFGQRLAKDYAGAAVLVPYFILQLIIIYLTNPFTK